MCPQFSNDNIPVAKIVFINILNKKIDKFVLVRVHRIYN